MVTGTLRTVFERLREDICTALERDPAARSVPEVLTYQGLHAVWLHRIEHRLWTDGHRLLARTLSQVTRFMTGVEIHPAADIGRRVFIDHGMGTVIGETADVGDDVHMYHGVTLGGDGPAGTERHPTVADGATLGASSTLVGPITVGEGATVGAGAVVVDDVARETTVVGNPAAPLDEKPDVPETVAESAGAAGTEPATADAAAESTGGSRSWLSC